MQRSDEVEVGGMYGVSVLEPPTGAVEAMTRAVAAHAVEARGAFPGETFPNYHSTALTPMDMLSRALASGAGMDVVEKLMGLQERFERNQARKAFDNAMAEAKAEMPVIFKNKAVSFGGKAASYRHEDLAEIARTVDPVLAKYGLSYRFNTKTTDQGGVTVTCIVSHRDGHSEENALSSSGDTTGSKNSIQAIGSAITYLQRYTLKAALGLAASADDDGRSHSTADDGGNEPITDEQVRQVSALVSETKSNLAIFLNTFAINGIPDIKARDLPRVLAKLEAKRAKLAATEATQ